MQHHLWQQVVRYSDLFRCCIGATADASNMDLSDFVLTDERGALSAMNTEMFHGTALKHSPCIGIRCSCGFSEFPKSTGAACIVEYPATLKIGRNMIQINSERFREGLTAAPVYAFAAGPPIRVDFEAFREGQIITPGAPYSPGPFVRLDFEGFRAREQASRSASR